VKRFVRTVWRHIVDARAWPTWYPPARDVTFLANAGSVRALTPKRRNGRHGGVLLANKRPNGESVALSPAGIFREPERSEAGL
jgi:hypothetical protein